MLGSNLLGELSTWDVQRPGWENEITLIVVERLGFPIPDEMRKRRNDSLKVVESPLVKVSGSHVIKSNLTSNIVNQRLRNTQLSEIYWALEGIVPQIVLSYMQRYRIYDVPRNYLRDPSMMREESWEFAMSMESGDA